MTADPSRQHAIRPLRVVMDQQQELRPLDRGKRDTVTTSQVLQLSLLLRGECDRILGPRAWHLKSPPTFAKVRLSYVSPSLIANSLHISCAVYLALRVWLQSADRHHLAAELDCRDRCRT